MPAGLYLIWSIEHRAWWKPRRYGYTRKMDEAGRYNSEESKTILAEANTVTVNECRIPVDCVAHTFIRPLPWHKPTEVHGIIHKAVKEDRCLAAILRNTKDELNLQIVGPPERRLADAIDDLAKAYRAIAESPTKTDGSTDDIDD